MVLGCVCVCVWVVVCLQTELGSPLVVAHYSGSRKVWFQRWLCHTKSDRPFGSLGERLEGTEGQTCFMFVNNVIPRASRFYYHPSRQGNSLACFSKWKPGGVFRNWFPVKNTAKGSILRNHSGPPATDPNIMTLGDVRQQKEAQPSWAGVCGTMALFQGPVPKMKLKRVGTLGSVLSMHVPSLKGQVGLVLLSGWPTKSSNFIFTTKLVFPKSLKFMNSGSDCQMIDFL